MKKYIISIATFLVFANYTDVVFNPYLFDIDTINAYQNIMMGAKEGL